MNYTKHEVSYPSTDGKSTVIGAIYTPSGADIIGVVQLAHGMIDYVERYEGLAEALTGAGYALAANHHLGHGKTASCKEDFGYFAKNDSVVCLLRDMHHMNRIIREEFPNKPVILMGHSMGSFLSRLYAVRYPHTISAHIIHGTGGPHKIILPMGRALVGLVSFFRGERYRSKFIAGVAFMGYNSKFDKSEGKYAWLTREGAQISGRDDDEYTNFIFTLQGYRELFKMTGKANCSKWFKEYPKHLRTLIISGDMDPVGDYGKGVKYVYKKMLLSGCSDLTLKLYEGARHELFNESCRGEVFSYLINWLNQCVKK